jgi:imidazolonepropionase-like amidohydrolase
MRKTVLFTLLLAGAAPVRAETVVVTADRMIDVLAGRVVEEPVVVITDGRIASVAGRGRRSRKGRGGSTCRARRSCRG